ncbi:hypothetical protein WN55_02047 [Dufourea novaeangliae]|uniref:Uncharacterized protein n=1 Tax=Dufourea novaeangliae TaxID=178035 RepID=A0A154NYR4_DUFNO|nr:hypothetical protein WN55_02047 [Dufourea novaeangliae]
MICSMLSRPMEIIKKMSNRKFHVLLDTKHKESVEQNLSIDYPRKIEQLVVDHRNQNLTSLFV